MKKRKAKKIKIEEMSIAELMIQGLEARACGESVDDWIADMLPDDELTAEEAHEEKE